MKQFCGFIQKPKPLKYIVTIVELQFDVIISSMCLSHPPCPFQRTGAVVHMLNDICPSFLHHLGGLTADSLIVSAQFWRFITPSTHSTIYINKSGTDRGM